MKVLIAGATGETGKLLVDQLLERGHAVHVIVRSPHKLSDAARANTNLTVTQAPILELAADELQELVSDCDAVASCLGHVPNFRGIWGKPHRLVTEATQRLCEAIRSNQPQQPVKFVLMNTTGNRNPDTDAPRTVGEKIVFALLRIILPPQVDNEQAAQYLQTQLEDDDYIEWTAVRPDGLIDEHTVTEYSIYPAVQRSPLFDAGKTSRINVAHFMAELISDDELWKKWKGGMPVVYNVQ